VPLAGSARASGRSLGGGAARWTRLRYTAPVTFEEMSPAERILHVQELWDRIAEEPESVPVSEEWKTELGRRLEAHRADPAAAIPWDQVKARLRQQP